MNNLVNPFLTTDLEYRPLLSPKDLENYLVDWNEERHYVYTEFKKVRVQGSTAVTTTYAFMELE